MIRYTWMMLVPVLLLVGCQPDKTTAEEVSARRQAIISNAVTNSVSSLVALSSSQLFASLTSASPAVQSATGLFDKLFGVSSSPSPDPQSPPLPFKSGGSDCVQGSDGSISCSGGEESTPMDPQMVAYAINAWLDANVFSDDNIESTDGDTVVYLMKGAKLCPVAYACTMSCNAGGSCTESTCQDVQDQGCVAFVDLAQIRIKATLVGEDGVDLELMFGSDRVSPITFELRSDEVATEVDLAAVKLAIESLSRLAGEEIDGIPSVMNGVVRVSLVINGEQDVSIDGAILEAVHVVQDGQNGPTTFDLADSTWSMRANGLLGQLTYSAAVSALDLVMPYADVTGNATSTGAMSFHLDGFSLDTILDTAVQALAINHIGLGAAPSFVKKDDITIFELNLNADAGRAFDLSVTPDESLASALFTFTPELDLQAMFNLAAIAADFPDIESYFLNETYRIHLFGAGSTSVLPLAGDANWAGGLKVTSGQLEISSTAVSAPVVVPEGMCLTSVADVPADAHPILGSFAVVACP